MVRYINMKSVHGTETVDELDSKDFKFFRDFRKELRRLLNEYRLCGMNVYSSQRSDKTWRN
jgi:hypothetical protein